MTTVVQLDHNMTDLNEITPDALDLTNVLLASEALLARRHLHNEKYDFSVHGDYLVKVTDRKTGFMVAYSSTKADFEQSVDEFMLDYWVRVEEEI